MKSLSSLSLLLLLLFSATLQAQPVSHHPHKAEKLLLVTETFEVLKVYEGIRQKLIIGVIDRSSPCGVNFPVRVEGYNCEVRADGKDRFTIRPGKGAGNLRVFYQHPEGMVFVKKIKLDPIPADLNDPAFQTAYPDPDRAKPLKITDKFEVKSARMTGNPDLQLFMPSAVPSHLESGESIQVRMDYLNGCEAYPTLELTGEGIEVRQLSPQNEFEISPLPGTEKATIKVFAREGGDKVLVKTLSYPVVSSMD